MFSDLWKSRSVQRSDVRHESRMLEGDGAAGLEKPPDKTTEPEHLPTATPIPSSTMLSNPSAVDQVDNAPQNATPNRPSKSPKTRRSTTPRSESAIRDGRKYLSAYRQHKRSKTPGDSNGASGKRPVNGAVGQGVIESLDVPPGLVDAFTERVGIYHSCAPGLARSLEAALNASVDRHGARGKVPDENFPKDGGGSASVTSLGTTAGSSRRTVGSSPERMTPEALRQAARDSQADFLSGFVPAKDTVGGPQEAPGASSVRAILQHRSSSSDVLFGAGADAIDRPHAKGRGASVDTDGISAADMAAVERWESLQRLQRQSLGLGSAAENQLGRALEVCRDIVGWQDMARVGGVLGPERAALLDALRSNLHGLEEIVSKKQAIDSSVQQETRALGGPAAIGTLLAAADESTRSARSGSREASDWMDGAVDREEQGGAVEEAGSEAAREEAGWVSGSQLKAFEEEIRARTKLEIAALESERRKLKGKVEMFQRQVQFLQRGSRGGAGDGGEPSPNAGDRGVSATESPEVSRSRLMAGVFDARLAEDKQLQSSLEAEVNTLRMSLEEKDGLIHALRQALRAAATVAPAQGREEQGVEHRGPVAQPVEETLQRPPTRDISSAGSTAPLTRVGLPRKSRRLSGRSRGSHVLNATGSVSAGATALEATADRERASRRGHLIVGGAVGTEHHGVVSTASEAGPEAPAAAERVGDSAGVPRDATATNVASMPVTASDSNGARESTAPRTTPSPSGGQVVDGASTRNGGGGIVAMATAVPGAALRTVWTSARAVGSTVGIRSSRPGPAKAAMRKGESSHAVLIL